MENTKRGAFIVIEGLDRAGKSTQAAALTKRLQDAGMKVQPMKFPDRTTPTGKMIDAYLRSESEVDDRVIHLLFSANRWELVSSIRSILDQGTHIICDRYAFSGVAYSTSKGLPFEWCRSPDVSLPAPDLTLFLDLEPEKARERGGYGEERYEKEEMQRRVRAIFKDILSEADQRKSPLCVTIDAGQDTESVGNAIWGHVSEVMARGDQPLSTLWESYRSTA